MFLVILVFILALLSTGYFFYKYQETKKLLAANPLSLSGGKSAIVAKVAALIDVPTNEDPTVATVSDIDKLKTQPFFAKAKNGNHVIIYHTAKKAILYDPVGNKILEVGSLLSSGPQVAGDTTSVPTSPPTPLPAIALATAGPPSPTPTIVQRRIILSNGTNVNGLTYNTEQNLAQYEGQYKVVKKQQAVKRDYEKTMVIDMSGTRPEEAQILAKRLDGSVSSLPEGEEKPTGADFLVIIGGNQQ